MGDEPYYIDKIADYIEKNVLDESEKSFNQTVVYGNDTDVHQVIDAAKRYPMMSNYQVVMVKEAQQLKKIEELDSYLDNPLNSTILVLCHKYKTIDKRKSFAKKLATKGVLFESKKLYENQIPDWINKYVLKKGYKISPPTTMLLSEYLGNDLSKIENEVSKIIINLKKGDEITTDDVEKYVGISKDFNFFELNKAVGIRDIKKANNIVHYFSKNPKDHPIVVTIGMLYAMFSKILMLHYTMDKSPNNLASILKVAPYFVKDYQIAARNYNGNKTVQVISLLRTYDLKSKGVGNVSASEGELLKELIYKIMH